MPGSHYGCMQPADGCMQPACSRTHCAGCTQAAVRRASWRRRLNCARKILHEQMCSFWGYFSRPIFVWNKLSQMGLVLAWFLLAWRMQAACERMQPAYGHNEACTQAAIGPYAGCISAYASCITPVCRLHASLCSLHYAGIHPAYERMHPAALQAACEPMQPAYGACMQAACTRTVNPA